MVRARTTAALLIVTALVLVVTGLVVGERHRPPTQRGTTVAAPGCTDILLLEIPGNAEGTSTSPANRGNTLTTFAGTYLGRARAAGRTVQQQVVDYRTAPLSTLRPANLSAPANKVIGGRKMLAWRTGAGAAVSSALTALRTAASACPDQDIVLAGYAQGAVVAHRLVAALAGTSIGYRVVAAALISDGERTSRTRATLRGAPLPDPARRGISTTLGRSRPDVPPTGSVTGVWSVCRLGDVVCDFSAAPAGKALGWARGYAAGPANSGVVRNTAASAYVRTSRVPRILDGQTFSGSVSGLLRGQVRVDVYDADRDALRFTPTSALPPGLALNEHGALTGVPTSSGTWQVSYTVRNTRSWAYSRTRSGSFTVAVSKNQTATLAAGGESSCAIRADHTLWCWGVNDWGQIGDGTLTDRHTPVRVGRDANWASVSTSGSHTCGVRTNKTLWCWGMNSYGQLGDGTKSKRLTPTQITTSSSWASVSASFFTTCGISVKGALYCWGQGRYGQLGNGTTQTKEVPFRVGTDVGWSQVAPGGSHTCALRSDGSAWCWGANDVGQLGLGSTTSHPSPVRVGTATDWTRLSSNWSNTCGLTTTGGVRCWGLNNEGQIGDGTRAMRTQPTTVSGGGSYSDLGVGDSHVCARRTDGTLWCWGGNIYGQLGNGSRTARWVPAPASGSGYVSVESGWEHSCAIVTDGSTVCWGVDDRGQLGDGGNISRTTPTTVLPG